MAELIEPAVREPVVRVVNCIQPEVRLAGVFALAYPSHSTGFEMDKPFRISEGYPKVFTTAKAVWRVVARAADGPATP
jgi:hypothetical protein